MLSRCESCGARAGYSGITLHDKQCPTAIARSMRFSEEGSNRFVSVHLMIDGSMVCECKAWKRYRDCTHVMNPEKLFPPPDSLEQAATTVIETFPYRSASSTRVYQVKLYLDGHYSCDCPSWTKGWKALGFTERTCKHVENVKDRRNWSKANLPPAPLAKKNQTPKSVPSPTNNRKFNFDI